MHPRAVADPDSMAGRGARTKQAGTDTVWLHQKCLQPLCKSTTAHASTSMPHGRKDATGGACTHHSNVRNEGLMHPVVA